MITTTQPTIPATGRTRIVSFPKLGDYSVPLNILAERTLDCAVIDAPPITKKTVELGAKFSPDTVCTPFKIILGNFLQSIDRGANTFIMPAFGCRLGFYDILHKQILLDMGKKIEMITLFDYYATEQKLFNSLSTANPALTREKFDKALSLCARIVCDMDELANTMRHNAAFETQKGDFDRAYQSYLNEIRSIKAPVHSLDDQKTAVTIGDKYREIMRKIEIARPKTHLKIGIVGDLYSVIEPHGNCHLVKYLTDHGVEVFSKIDLTYLSKTLFDVRTLIERSGGYVNYNIGGNANNTIALAYEFADTVDGIIHVKAATCTPEITAMTILQRISNDKNVPVMYLTFDTETAEAGLHTRLEAFLDMLEARPKKKEKQ